MFLTSSAARAPKGLFAAVAAAPLLGACTSSLHDDLSFIGHSAPVPMTQITLTGKINKDKADTIIAQLDRIPDNEGVRFIIDDSPGGDVTAGLAIYNSLRKHKRVDTVCKNEIASMAALLFSMNEKGARIADAQCKSIMLHNIYYYIPSIENAAITVNDINFWSKDILQSDTIIGKALERSTGMKPDVISAFLHGIGDCTITPVQAADFGIVTKFSTSATLTQAKSRSNLTPDYVYSTCKTMAPSMYDELPATPFKPQDFGLKN